MERRRVPFFGPSAHANHADDDDDDYNDCSTRRAQRRNRRETIKQQNNDNGFNAVAANSSWDEEGLATINNQSSSDNRLPDRSWPSHAEKRGQEQQQYPLAAGKYLPPAHLHQHQHQQQRQQRQSGRSMRKSALMQYLVMIAVALLTVQLHSSSSQLTAQAAELASNVSLASPVKDLAAAESAPPKETIVASETQQRVEQQQQLAYAPPVDPTESTTSNLQSGQPATTLSSNAETTSIGIEQQQQQQQDVPAVSGLVNQQEEQQQLSDQQSGGGGDSNQPQPQQELTRQQSNAEADQQQQQQLQISVDEPESESARIASRPQQQQSSENDVSTNVSSNGGGGTDFARKASSSPSSPPLVEQNSKRGSRTLKRAFGGHTGIFGRKQRLSQQQAEEQQQQQQQAEQQVEQQQQQQPQPQPQPQRAQRGRDYHYYYTAAPTARPQAATTRQVATKLKEADYPNDYREILIQPDRQTKSAAASNQFEEHQQQIIEQTHEQVVEDLAPLTTELPTQSTLSVVAEADENPPKSGPYIRLSNIATINSTANQPASNGSSEGEMKLMRIYVIDLDQKLVVGNQQPISGNEPSSSTLGDVKGGGTPSLKQVVSNAIAQQQQLAASTTAAEQINTRASEPQMSTIVMASTTDAPVVYQQQHQHHQQEVNTERYVVDHSPVVEQTQQKTLVNYTIDHQLAAAGYLQTAPEAHQYVMTVPNKQHGSLMVYSPQVSSSNSNSSGGSSYNYNSSLGSTFAVGSSNYNHGSFGQQQHDDRNNQQQQQQQVAVYLQPVPVQQQQQQMYPVVPQYIAPQYNTQQQVSVVQISSNPDKEQYHQLQQQQQQLYSSPSPALSSYSSSSLLGSTGSPGASQQQHGNYTSGSSGVVQAPGRLLYPAQDKHHANLNVYQQQPQHSSDEQSVYQQPAQSSHYGSSGSSEPAQNHRKQQQQQQYNEPAAYKVTTSEQHWKPVDYLAPGAAAAYSQTSAGHHQAAPINPAQHYSATTGQTTASNKQQLINGYSSSSSLNSSPNLANNYSAGYNFNRDHDVVSLANGSVALRHQPGHYQVELVQANISSGNNNNYHNNNTTNYHSADASLSSSTFDGQHAPQLNYQARKTYPAPTATGYVNNGSTTAAAAAAAAGVVELASVELAEYPGASPNSYQASHHKPASGHPSSYNGTVEWPVDTSQALAAAVASADSYAAGPTVTNEYPSMVKLTTNYGAGSASAYGKSNKLHHHHHHHQQQQQYEIPQSQPAVQSQPQPQHFRPASKTYNKPAPSAYLAVNGPPISDGVYESSAVPESGPPQQVRYNKPKGKRPANRPQGKHRANNKQPTHPHKGKDHDSHHQLALEQAEQYVAEGEHFQQQPYRQPPPPYAPGGARPGPMYRPQSAGPKSFLSWETISSVASGAAKRLPSLSSILSPFGAVTKQQLYPTVNQQQHYAGPPHKSAHYDRDVASFHRPYPLRHANQGYMASYTESNGGPHKYPEAESQEYAGDESDLSSSSSSEDGESQPDEPSNSDPNSEQEAAAADNQAQGKTIKLMHINNSSLAGGVIEASSELPTLDQYKPVGSSVELAGDGDKGEPMADLAEINPADQPKQSPRPKGKKRGRPSDGAEPVVDQQSGGHQEGQLDQSHAAVLSSLEHHQLDGPEVHAGRPARKSPMNNKNKPQVGGYVEPTITSSSAGGELSFDSLPADQQRLLLQQTKGSKPPSPPVRFPSAHHQNAAAEHQLLFNQEGRPVGLPPGYRGQHPHPQGLGSLQIGQYKITPQTQFVQNIIEPSRQVLGQYLNRYIGQLGQLAHG